VYVLSVNRARDRALASATDVEPSKAPASDPHAEDARLVLAARAGSRAAEEQLYLRHASKILRLATRLLRSTDDARDVLQDTFIFAFEELDGLLEPRALEGWLRSICVRLVHRRFRRHRLLELLGLELSAEDAKLEQQVATTAGPEVRAELRLVDQLLDRLPTSEKVAWVLRHVEGLSLSETAEACNCSLATVKRRIAAADAVVERLRAGVVQ
jgi:RNA polymerase sigma-70 factor (ECF subfamily)